MKLNKLAILYTNNDKVGKVKEIKFNDSVSIITGQSKKGKSAILEIIDYCLFSSSNIIPEGIIKETTKAFVLSLYDYDNVIYIYRNVINDKMKIVFLDKESDYHYKFDDIEENKNDVQLKFEKYLGLLITKEEVEKFNLTNDFKKQKYSIRYQLPYNFLAQNIIANKDVLFRNFSESRYRKNMIEQFKYFCGLESISDYIINMKINNLNNEIKKIEKLYSKNEQSEKELLLKINLFLESFDLKKVESVNEFLKLENNIGTKQENIKENDVEYSRLINEIKEQRNQLKKIIENNTNDKYLLSKIKEDFSQKIKKKENHEDLCPVCGKEDSTYSTFINELEDSIERMSSFSANNKIYQNEIQKNIQLNENEIQNITNEINSLYKSKREYEDNKIIKNGDSQSYFKGYYKLKAQVDLLNINDNEKLEELRNQVRELKEKRSTNRDKVNEFKYKLSKNLTNIVKQFDIEEEFSQFDLIFDIDKFDYYFENGSIKKHLSNTGSGANWLSMHIALNFSILKTLKDMNLNSTLLNFIVLDQPTQAYFTTDSKSKDYQTVTNMFETLFSLAEKEGIQIIILEHAKSDDFSKTEDLVGIYKGYTVEDWHNESGLLDIKKYKKDNEPN